jgi:hypothetical protein
MINERHVDWSTTEVGQQSFDPILFFISQRVKSLINSCAVAFEQALAGEEGHH